MDISVCIYVTFMSVLDIAEWVKWLDWTGCKYVATATTFVTKSIMILPFMSY